MPGIIGQGATIGYCATVDGSYTLVTGLLDIAPGKKSVGNAETTTFDDTDETFIPAFRNGGSWAFTIRHDATVLAGIDTLASDDPPDIYYWQFALSNGDAWSFQAFVESIEPNIPLKKVTGDKFSIKITGPVAFAPAS